MSLGELVRVLLLAPLLFGGCLVQTSPNANTGVVASPSAESRPTPESSPRPEPPGPSDVAVAGGKLESYLRGAATRSTPTPAVPGLSPHGQSRAFDSQVMSGSQLVAGPSGAGAWDRDGWTEKVRRAVTRASTKFTGPLASPREPWRYDYRP